MQNTIYSLTFLSGKKYWRETLDCGNCLPLYVFGVPTNHVAFPRVNASAVQLGFGGQKDYFVFSRPLSVSGSCIS